MKRWSKAALIVVLPVLVLALLWAWVCSSAGPEYFPPPPAVGDRAVVELRFANPRYLVPITNTRIGDLANGCGCTFRRQMALRKTRRLRSARFHSSTKAGSETGRPGYDPAFTTDSAQVKTLSARWSASSYSSSSTGSVSPGYLVTTA